MTIKSSGSLSILEINQEFLLGDSLSNYQNIQWWTDSDAQGNYTTGYFSGGSIAISDFYGKRSTPPASNIISLAEKTTADYRYTGGDDPQSGLYGSAVPPYVSGIESILIRYISATYSSKFSTYSFQLAIDVPPAAPGKDDLIQFSIPGAGITLLPSDFFCAFTDYSAQAVPNRFVVWNWSDNYQTETLIPSQLFTYFQQLNGTPVPIILEIGIPG